MSAQRIVIAGYMGCGKSTSARWLAEQGYRVIDADAEAKRTMQNDPGLIRELGAQFGERVIPGGTIDFGILGTFAFASKESLTTLNRIVHPPVVQNLSRTIEALGRQPFVLDAALAPLWPLNGMFDLLIWMNAPQTVRMNRILAKTAMNRADIQKRMNLQEETLAVPAQPPWVLLENTSSHEDLIQRLSALLNQKDTI